jgi:hypothetical protein
MEIISIECYQPVKVGQSVKICIGVGMGHSITEFGTVGVIVDGDTIIPWTNIAHAKIVPMIAAKVSSKAKV